MDLQLEPETEQLSTIALSIEPTAEMHSHIENVCHDFSTHNLEINGSDPDPLQTSMEARQEVTKGLGFDLINADIVGYESVA